MYFTILGPLVLYVFVFWAWIWGVQCTYTVLLNFLNSVNLKVTKSSYRFNADQILYFDRTGVCNIIIITLSDIISYYQVYWYNIMWWRVAIVSCCIRTRGGGSSLGVVWTNMRTSFNWPFSYLWLINSWSKLRDRIHNNNNVTTAGDHDRIFCPLHLQFSRLVYIKTNAL